MTNRPGKSDYMSVVTSVPDYNRTNLNYRDPLPRPKVRGKVIDFHCHLLSVRHAPAWFAAADHFGIDFFVTMMQLEEAMSLYRDYGDRIAFIAVPSWQAPVGDPVDDYLRRVEAFYNMGCRIVKFPLRPRVHAQTRMVH